MAINLGFVGVGEFGSCFIPIYQDHPEVNKIVLCDLKQDLLAQKAQEFGIEETASSLDELLARDDIDAVAIYTQHWLHAEQAIKTMKAGKHVTTAVPAAYSIDQVRRLVETVKQTGMVYSVQETSVYYPAVAYARQKYREGKFGEIFFSEGCYFHDWSHGLEEVYRRRYGNEYDKEAGDPPMMYVTHSTSGIMRVTGTYATEISCMGYHIKDDPVYDGKKVHGNKFGNQVGFMKMNDGSTARIAEFRRVAYLGEPAFSFYGNQGSFVCDPYKWYTLQGSSPVELPRFHSPLPKELVQYVFGGHHGSHPYLVHDFINAVVNNTTPENNIWEAARHVLPGLVAVESAKNQGKWMNVPDFGDAPAKPGPVRGVIRPNDGWFQGH